MKTYRIKIGSAQCEDSSGDESGPQQGKQVLVLGCCVATPYTWLFYVMIKALLQKTYEIMACSRG